MIDPLADPRSLLAFIVDRVNVGIFVVDRGLNLVLWNRFMEIHSGRTAEEVIGRPLLELFPELPQRWLRKKIESVFLLENFAFTSWEQRPYLFRFRHTRPVTGGVDHMYQDCTFLPIKDRSSAVRYVCVSVLDVTDTAVYQKEREEALAAMEEMSVRDSLTGLYNRRHLERVLDSEFSRIRRYGGTLSVMLFDIDHFKRVNDSFGHQAGDAVLKVVAERLEAVLRQSDIAGRYGGEEFMVILPGSDLEGALTLAERLREEIAATPVLHRELRIPLTVSAGVSQLRADTPSHERLLSEADIVLYQAKEQGRNRVLAYRPG